MLADLAFATLLWTITPVQTPEFDPQARVTEAIQTVRPVAYRSAAVDWTTLEAQLRAMAEPARDTADMLPIYRRLLDALGDHHSFVQAPTELTRTFVARHGRELYTDKPSRPRTSTFGDRDMVDHHSLAISSQKSVQWISVPKVFGAGDRAQAYAAHLFMATADVASKNCGYIIDVRGNTGGNIWPMLTGLSGLLGDGPVGRETKADGSVLTYAQLRDGVATIIEDGEFKGREIIRSSTWRSIPALQAAPVALLMDDRTASSGEGVSVAMRGRPNTRSFGQPTFGVSTSNNGFMLSDGVNLVVTVGVMTDRNGVAYPSGLTPDEIVAFSPGSPDEPADAQVEAAKAWLATQPACAAPN